MPLSEVGLRTYQKSRLKMWTDKKILVTGGHGFLGRHLIQQLKKLDVNDIRAPSSSELDLTIRENCKKVVQDIDIVFHLAGKGGGIGHMRDNPGDIFFENLMMGTQLFHEAKESNIEKFVALGTVCSYPKFSNIPFIEEDFWKGYPEETNAAYGLSKKMMAVQSQAYKQQFGFNSIVIIPTNMYGPYDNFNPITSHVIPAIIMKIQNAKKNNIDFISVWGDGSPTRDFLFVEDTVRGIILAAEKYNESEPINLGSEEEISIIKLVQKISNIMEFKGEIKWDTTKPNGQPRRCVSYKKLREKFGFRPQVTLDEGLEKTINWFNENFS